MGVETGVELGVGAGADVSGTALSSVPITDGSCQKCQTDT